MEYSILKDSAEWRPQPFWSWNDKLSPRELLRQIDEMHRAGYGGFFMHSRVGLVTRYLSDEWFSLVRICAEYAHSLGMKAWLYDEDMWPSGYASGEVVRLHPEFRHRALLSIPPDEIRPDDEVVSPGKDRAIVIRYAPVQIDRFNDSCYIDTMNPLAVRCFLDCTHERYAKAVGDLFGEAIEGIFTDEPSYTLFFYGRPFVPYSEYLRDRIRKKFGYDILTFARSLFEESEEAPRIRREYYACANEQFLESYMGQYRAWCDAHGLKFTGHFGCEDTMLEQVMVQGSVMAGYPYFTMPGIDKLQRPLEQLVTVRQLTSAARQLGDQRSLCECFAGIGHESGFRKRKQIADWLCLNGINFLNPHLTPYSLRGERKRDYPPALGWQQPWWGEEEIFSAYLERMCRLAALPEVGPRILLIQPLDTVASLYSPETDLTAIREIDRRFRELSEGLLRAQAAFDYGDESLIAEYGKVENGQLVIGKQSYSAVVLCDCRSLRETTRSLLVDLSRPPLLLGRTPEGLSGESVDTPSLILKFSARVVSFSEENGEEVHPSPRASGALAVTRAYSGGRALILCNTEDRRIRFRLRDPAFCRVLDCMRGISFPLPGGEGILEPWGSAVLIDGPMLSDWTEGDLQGFSADGCLFTVGETALSEDWKIRFGLNMVPLCRADFETADMALKDEHLWKIWHRHFYPLDEGTSFRMIYRFRAECLPESLFAAIENAENLDEVLLNGKPVRLSRKRGEEQCLDEKAWLDLCLTRADLSGLVCLGENELEIRGKKVNNITGVCMHRTVTEPVHQPTEAEAIYLVGTFGAKVSQEGAVTLTEEKISDPACFPRYSGKVSLTREGLLPVAPPGERLFLEVEGGDFASAELEADGVLIGKRVTLPFRFDLTEFAGSVKKLELRLANTLFPLLGPHGLKDCENLLWIDPGVFNDPAQRGAERAEEFQIGRIVWRKEANVQKGF